MPTYEKGKLYHLSITCLNSDPKQTRRFLRRAGAGRAVGLHCQSWRAPADSGAGGSGLLSSSPASGVKLRGVAYQKIKLMK